MSAPDLAIVGVPSSAGARLRGQEEGPAALRTAGLGALLAARGLTLVDYGDLPRAEFRPDRDNPRAQNAALVAAVCRRVAQKTGAVCGAAALPIVLGGDCSITIGVVAGLCDRVSRLGIVYFDGDLDLNTPATTPSGAFDGMVSAHLLGRGDPELARIGPRLPLLDEPDLVFFGYNEADGGIDPPELDWLERSASLRYPLRVVRRDPLGSAAAALAALEARVGHILVHFDVDVTDVPAVDVAHPHGLSLDTAGSILEIFLSSPRCVGLVVTELNPRRDVDGSVTRRLAERLSAALAGAAAAREPHSPFRRGGRAGTGRIR